MPRLRASCSNQFWIWDISYLHTIVPGLWLNLYLVIYVLSGKVVVWVVTDCEEPGISADLVSRACIHERFSRDRKHLFVLHADTAMPCAAVR